MKQYQSDFGAGAVMLLGAGALGMWWPNGFLALAGSVLGLAFGFVWFVLSLSKSQG